MRTMIWKRRDPIDVLIRIAAMGLLSLVAASAWSMSSDSNEIRVAITSDIRSSYPGVNRVSFTDDVMIHVVEPLVAHRDDLSVAPLAAERIDVSDDLTQFRFTLRDGLRFHNGELATADDVVYSWQRILDPATGFQCLPFFDGSTGAKVESVVAEDARTVLISLDQPSAVFLEQLAYVQCPVAVLHRDSWDSDGKWLAPVGTGPFQFLEWRKGRYVLLKRFSDYAPATGPASGLAGAKTAHVEYLRFLVIPDVMATTAALVSGQIDVVPLLAPVNALELRHNRRVVAMDHDGLSRRTLLLQTDDALLSDRSLRLALAHALDLEQFADVASFGLSPHNPSAIPTSDVMHTAAQSKTWSYDPDLARQLLEAAGYNGEELVIITSRSEQAIFDLAMIAQAMWSRVGINVRIEVLDFGSLLTRYFDGDFQIAAFEFSPRLTAIMNMHTLIGDKTASPARWDDPRAHDLLQRASETVEPIKRQRLLDEIHHLLLAEAPTINVYNAPIIDVVSTRLEGYQPWAGANPRLWNVRKTE
ncbi:MAG: ABC transporter substrate-binding protein [Pseudomonadota bacterium]